MKTREMIHSVTVVSPVIVIIWENRGSHTEYSTDVFPSCKGHGNEYNRKDY